MAVTPLQATTRSTQQIPRRDVPPIELPAGTGELASEAAAQLGWHGTVLELTVLGRKIAVVARLRPEVHAERLAVGAAPLTDRATVSTWTWPEFSETAPAPAADIVGVLSVARHWRTGLAWIVPFARYFPESALVLPSDLMFTPDYVDNCLPRARAYGLAIVSVSDESSADLNLAGRNERRLLDDDALTRWLNEVVYAELLTESGAGVEVAST